jgi:hypothetical protein
MTIQQLEQLFGVYLPDLDNLRSSKCYWPMLHVILSMPDICAALESNRGETSAAQYRDWCSRYLTSPFLTPADRYKMRCSVLHQGSSKPDSKGVASQYASFSFVDPENAPLGSHGRITQHSDGLNLTLDIAMLADEMAGAVRQWFAELQKSSNSHLLANIAHNKGGLVRVQQKELVFPSTTFYFQTTSST